MTIFKCDLCGAENKTARTNIFRVQISRKGGKTPEEEADLCDTCYKALLDFATGQEKVNGHE